MASKDECRDLRKHLLVRHSLIRCEVSRERVLDHERDEILSAHAPLVGGVERVILLGINEDGSLARGDELGAEFTDHPLGFDGRGRL